MATVNRFPYSGTFDIPKTSNGNPPSKPPPPKGSGDYCFRAHAQLYQDGEEAVTFTGYDKVFSIVDNVQNVCERYKEKRDGTLECTKAKLFFMGPHPKCNGEIHVDVNLR